MLALGDLCSTFSERARWTPDVIGQGLASRLGVLEETITDVNLLSIASEHRNYVYTKKFSRRQEGAESGADWLWCIGESGAWLNLLVQAKIVNPQTGRCRYLNYDNGRQRSRLLQFARNTQSVPLYVIYCHVPLSYEPPLKASPHFSGLPASEWGCSIITPQRVRQLVSTKRLRLDDVLGYAIPWAQPFCQSHDEKSVALGRGLADGLAKTYEVLQDQHPVSTEIDSGYWRQQESESEEKRTQWERVDPRTIVHDGFPQAVSRLLMAGATGKAPVAGVSIISAVPIEDAPETRQLTFQEAQWDRIYIPGFASRRSDE